MEIRNNFLKNKRILDLYYYKIYRWVLLESITSVCTQECLPQDPTLNGIFSTSPSLVPHEELP